MRERNGSRERERERARGTRWARSNDHAAERGFTLLEIVIVLGIMATLAGSIVPLVSAAKRAEGIDTARAELELIAEGLRRFYYERGSFPPQVDAAGFYGVFVQPGVDNARLRDEWGTRARYRLVRTRNPDTATAYSVGDNGRDDGAGNEAIKVTVQGALPGGERTRERMAVIAAAVARHVRAGGTLSGRWARDRAALGLGAEYARDGFGTAFRLDAATLVLRSAGADRTFNNADDITP
jgi:prepilin-type N-terminal cleavage/methylation domain-containing protein